MKSKTAKQMKSTGPAAQTGIPCPAKCFFVSVHIRVAHWPLHSRRVFICNHRSQSCLTPKALSLRTNAIPESLEQGPHTATQPRPDICVLTDVCSERCLAAKPAAPCYEAVAVSFQAKAGSWGERIIERCLLILRPQPRNGPRGPRMGATRHPPGPLHPSPHTMPGSSRPLPTRRSSRTSRRTLAHRIRASPSQPCEGTTPSTGANAGTSRPNSVGTLDDSVHRASRPQSA